MDTPLDSASLSDVLTALEREVSTLRRGFGQITDLRDVEMIILPEDIASRKVVLDVLEQKIRTIDTLLVRRSEFLRGSQILGLPAALRPTDGARGYRVSGPESLGGVES